MYSREFAVGAIASILGISRNEVVPGMEIPHGKAGKICYSVFLQDGLASLGIPDNCDIKAADIFLACDRENAKIMA